jgi:hypothetical protein
MGEDKTRQHKPIQDTIRNNRAPDNTRQHAHETSPDENGVWVEIALSSFTGKRWRGGKTSRQDNTRQDQKRLDKTKPDKRQDKTKRKEIKTTHDEKSPVGNSLVLWLPWLVIALTYLYESCPVNVLGLPWLAMMLTCLLIVDSLVLLSSHYLRCLVRPTKKKRTRNGIFITSQDETRQARQDKQDKTN